MLRNKIARPVIIGAKHNSNWQAYHWEDQGGPECELAAQKRLLSFTLQGTIFNGGHSDSFNSLIQCGIYQKGGGIELCLYTTLTSSDFKKVY